MFTGLVDHTGEILACRESESGRWLRIATRFADLVPGESVAVDGCCLTVTELSGGSFDCDLSSETLAKTLAGDYREGRRVNLERALRLSDRLGGHLVTGHVEGTARLIEREVRGDCVRMRFADYPKAGRDYLMPKGSVALSGISLTVNEVGEDFFEVMVIPHTLERTTSGQWQVGTTVNVEWDWMAKWMVNEARKRLALVHKE